MTVCYFLLPLGSDNVLILLLSGSDSTLNSPCLWQWQCVFFSGYQAMTCFSCRKAVTVCLSCSQAVTMCSRHRAVCFLLLIEQLSYVAGYGLNLWT